MISSSFRIHLRAYGARVTTTDGLTTLEMVDPNDNARTRHQYRLREGQRERRALGELDHPSASVVNLQNASHIIVEARWDGDAVVGAIELLNELSVVSVEAVEASQ